MDGPNEPALILGTAYGAKFDVLVIPSRPFPKPSETEGEKVMSTPASIAKHPIHPMLVALPIGLFVSSLVCDLIYAGTYSPNWSTVALYTMGGGIVGALLAAVPGFIDFLSIRESETQAIAWKHMLTNVSGLIIFIVNFFLRLNGMVAWTVGLMLSIAGVLVFAFGGWLGGEMVYVKGLAVEPVEELSKKAQRAEEEQPRLRRVS
jgi:uncharacterized membrane protein